MSQLRGWTCSCLSVSLILKQSLFKAWQVSLLGLGGLRTLGLCLSWKFDSACSDACLAMAWSWVATDAFFLRSPSPRTSSCWLRQHDIPWGVICWCKSAALHTLSPCIYRPPRPRSHANVQGPDKLGFCRPGGTASWDVTSLCIRVPSYNNLHPLYVLLCCRTLESVCPARSLNSRGGFCRKWPVKHVQKVCRTSRNALPATCSCGAHSEPYLQDTSPMRHG